MFFPKGIILVKLIANKPQLRTSCQGLINQVSQRFASRLFTEKHEWFCMKDETKQIGRVGISQHAQEALGDVVYVQNPDIGSKINQFDEIGAIESVKAASELLTPVSGEVVSINSQLEDKPSLVNSDCYGDGWLFEVKLSDSKELGRLMDEEAYNKYLAESKDS